MTIKKTTEPNTCPICGNDDFSYFGIHDAVDGIYENAVCNQCGADLEIWYAIKFKETIGSQENEIYDYI